ncbi:MAG TPA: permease-like cell division protein FtsX [Bacteroidia bacterium]|nr:permease-like cell division protein FtsX [Bacteroidia bacterium]
MARNKNFLRSRTRSTFWGSLFTISLVLFFLNIFAAGAIYSHILFVYSQENFEVFVELPDHVAEDKRQSFEAFLKKQAFVKEMHYTSKDAASKLWQKENGTEFMEIMDGLNPFPASYNIKLKFEWINTESVAKVQQILEEQTILTVQDVTYPMSEIEQLRANTYGFIKFGLIIGVIVTLIAFYIVNNTIRLAIYGKRLMIRTMQLIGATSGFIRWPFVRMGILQGMLGALVADLMLVGLIFAFSYLDLGLGGIEMEGFSTQDMLMRYEFMLLSSGILIFGTFLGWLSSTWAVSRFLNKDLDQLM